VKITYNKLIRDRIPEIIHESGKQAQVEVMSETEYRKALLEKLVEEAQEATLASTKDDLITELADLYEVIEALFTVWNIQREEVLRIQKERHLQRGGFDGQLKLLWTE
jgi:predicted house-cleaning noncanonical NTP pyrophosphatase (MazG superfamily)